MDASSPEPADVAPRVQGPAQVWLTAAIAGLSVAWPGICMLLFNGRLACIRFVGGDAYHYLAIARKAVVSHMYTYDGVHPTNGFHPLWEYTLRAIFTLFPIHTHMAQAFTLIVLAFVCASIGVAFASAAVVRMTGHRFLGLLLAPGLMSILCETASLSIWTATDGMEGAYTILFTGIFFYAASHFIGLSARPFSIVAAARSLGLILPFIVLSRLDDVFLIPAFLIAILLFEPFSSRRLQAALWIATPTTLALLAYLIYNKFSVGVAMPLSGATKFHPSFIIFVYIALAAHLPFIALFSSHFPHWLQSSPTQWVPTGDVLFYNGRFHSAQVVYPLLISVFAAAALWRYQKKKPEFAIVFAVFLGIAFKMLYNFTMVHPWDQASWYYSFTALSFSVLGAFALAKPYRRLAKFGIAQAGVITLYILIFFLTSAQRYGYAAYPNPWQQDQETLWQTHDEVRAQLVSHGIHGLINFDDGITAFLLDMPMMHGLAFATDPAAKQAHTSGHMLSLAASRGIDGITGFGYLQTSTPPSTDSSIRAFLLSSLGVHAISADADQYTFSLAYYDPALKLPFFKFTPRNPALPQP